MAAMEYVHDAGDCGSSSIPSGDLRVYAHYGLLDRLHKSGAVRSAKREFQARVRPDLPSNALERFNKSQLLKGPKQNNHLKNTFSNEQNCWRR